MQSIWSYSLHDIEKNFKKSRSILTMLFDDNLIDSHFGSGFDNIILGQ